MSLTDRYIGEYVELFEIDASVLGGSIARFTNNRSSTPILWGGNEYEQVPCESVGWSSGIDGGISRSSLNISNVNRYLMPMIHQTGDIAGATFTRHKILSENLDGGDNPNTTPLLPSDKLTVIQMVSVNHSEISLALSTELDNPNLDISKHTMLTGEYPGLLRNY